MTRSSWHGFRWMTAAAAVAAAASGALAIDTKTAAADPLLDLPFGQTTGCTYYCRSCNDDRHEIIQAITTNATSSHLENCNPGSCSQHACGGDHVAQAEQVGELWFAIREAQDGRLRKILSEHRKIAFYNSERDAVQLLGCEGSVVASIPLTEAQVAILEE